MSRPPLHALQAFVAIARTRNLTRAATQLNLTVSALSHQMRALEERMNQRLLLRGPRGVTLTAQGERLLEDIAPRLKRGVPVSVETVQTRLPEGRLAAGLAQVQKDFPGLAIGSYPFYREDGSGVQLVVRGRDPDAVDKAAAAIEAVVRSQGAEALRLPK